ncbi:MAG: ribose-5-phosphate isomerase RpiA [Gammaproteobacteria bacterium]
MNQEEKKEISALKALEIIKNKLNEETVLGIGTGSTTNLFIRMLLDHDFNIKGVVCSSNESEKQFKDSRYNVLSLNDVHKIDFYIDGADEFNDRQELIKGGGAALTREKILAQSSDKFICIVDDSKRVSKLGSFPLPIEVIELARSAISRELLKMGGRPVFRQGIITDNGNQIIDIHNLKIDVPYELEKKINNIPGVVENGIFSNRKADIIIISSERGVRVEGEL